MYYNIYTIICQLIKRTKTSCRKYIICFFAADSPHNEHQIYYKQFSKTIRVWHSYKHFTAPYTTPLPAIRIQSTKSNFQKISASGKSTSISSAHYNYSRYAINAHNSHLTKLAFVCTMPLLAVCRIRIGARFYLVKARETKPQALAVLCSKNSTAKYLRILRKMPHIHPP